jgi:hypothetical protein
MEKLRVKRYTSYNGHGRLDFTDPLIIRMVSMNCFFCKQKIPTGATVCGHCGAEDESILIEPSTPILIRMFKSLCWGVSAYLGSYVYASFRGDLKNDHIQEVALIVGFVAAVWSFLFWNGRWVSRRKIRWVRNNIMKGESD